MMNFSAACERNKAAILQQLFDCFSGDRSVLEIGSYSGQHALYFCQHFPELAWQPTDVAENIAALNTNIAQANMANCLPAICLDVADSHAWPKQQYDHIYTANTLHIMSWPHVQALFLSLPKVCRYGSLLSIYGPFKYNGQYTSGSNEKFQTWLQQRDIHSGIRDFEQVNALALAQGFILQADVKMPANNQLLTWRKG